MGKRSAKKAPAPKKKEVLATVFACLFCNHERSVSVKIDRKAGVGQLSCKVCGQSFQCSVNYLSAAVDVYSEWVDACDAVAKEGGADEETATASRYEPPRRSLGRENSGKGQIEDDEDDGVGGYGGESDGIVNDDDDY